MRPPRRLRHHLTAALLALVALPALPLTALADEPRDEPRIDASELSNGLDLIVVEKHNAPLVTIEIAVRTGSFTETPETNGLSHLYEHMFFKGNAALPTQERYMARMRELGISFNGTTSTERVNYFITLPARNFAPGMQFMADAILSPLFNQDELVSERKVVIGEYDRNEADPMHYLRVGMREHLYGADAYRKNPLGVREVILSATQDTMRDFQAKYYVPNNASLLVVGDVNPTEVKVLVERLLGPRRWKAGADPHVPPRAPLPRLSETKTFVVHRETPLVVLSAGWPGPDVGRDERATFVADVWGTLLSLPHGRFQRVFRDRELADSVGMHYYTQREGGEINFQGLVRDGKVFEVRDALLTEVAAMAEAGYWTEEELALAQRTLKISRAYEAESGADLSHTLSFWWASSSLDYYARYLEETGSVTLDELRAFARNYLVGRPMVLGCLTSDENAERLGITAEALEPKLAPGSAAASAVEELTLDNGVRVLFRREPGAAVAALQVMFDGGCLDLREDKQGVDKLLLSTLLDGSRQTSRDELQARLMGLGARHGADANYDFSRLSLTAPRESFPETVALLAECLREPRFEPASVTQRRSQMLTALGAEKSNPDDYVVRVLNQVFFAGHPYRLRPDGTPESVEALTPKDLRARLAELLVSGRMLLVLVGDMETKQARALLQQQFGFAPAGSWSRPALGAFTPAQLLDADTREIPTTYVLGKCAAPAPGHPDYPAARLAFSYLRKQLWESLRTKHALTYAPGAGISIYRGNYGYLYVSTTQPEKAVRLMFEEIRRMQEQPIPMDDLQGLIAQEETRAYSTSEAAASHSQSLGHAELTTGSWRSHYDLPASLARITPADVQRVARTYLKDFAWGLIGPQGVSEPVLRGESGE